MTGITKYHGHSQIQAPYQLMLIVAVLLAAYYPIAFGDFSRIDDHSIVDSVRSIELRNVPELFIPHVKYGAYYRPVLFLSFLLDKYLFNLDPGFMHLHNIILHVINALLIFWLVRQLTGDRKQGENLIPLMSALVFGLHPIATEPVSWIGGRTDVLACTFILLSANCIILFKKEHSYWYVALSALFMSLGFLTKEVAIAFLPGAFLLMHTPLNPAAETVPEQGTSSQGLLQRYRNLFFLLSGSGAILLFSLLRHFAFESNNGRIVATVTFIQSDIIRAGLIFLQALGFYVKKIFFPFPLNFAITELDPLYELLGVPVVVLCFLIISKRSKVSALFMTGIFLILPSFIIAFGQIAWTSFAERYMYLPTAFIMVSSVIFVSGFLDKIPSLSVKKEASVALLLVVMAIATFHRSTVWEDSLSFLKDTVEKNPDFYYIRGQYADELAMRGDIKNARIQYTIANEYNKRKKRLKNAGDFIQLQYWEMPELGLADLLTRERKIPEAITAYEKIILDSRGESTQALNNVIVLYDGLLNDAGSRSDSDRIKRKLLFYSEKFYKKSVDANAFFWLGRRFLMRGENREALAYFRKAESKFSAGDPMKLVSRKFIARLENK
jgi:tetratricopeptide (TPR) repeat protein